MAVSGKFLSLALASVAAIGLASSASAAVQVATLNSGNPIFVPPSVQFMTNMVWTANGSDTGVVEFKLGSALTLNTASFTNSGASSNVFDFSNVVLYAGSYTANGGSFAGLSVIPAASMVWNVAGSHAASLLPTILSTGSYTLAYNGTASGVTDGANVNGNVSFESPVPEAATWMMMVAGFGLMGAAMRRRTRTQVTFA